MLPFTTDTVTIQTIASMVDQYGDETRDPGGSATSRTTAACVQLDFSTDDRADPGRTKKRVTTGRLWLAPDDPITPDDTVLYRGLTFEVQGRPILKSAPFGNLDHLVVNISLVRG